MTFLRSRVPRLCARQPSQVKAAAREEIRKPDALAPKTGSKMASCSRKLHVPAADVRLRAVSRPKRERFTTP
jgi:hypothetical protein